MLLGAQPLAISTGDKIANKFLSLLVTAHPRPGLPAPLLKVPRLYLRAGRVFTAGVLPVGFAAAGVFAALDAGFWT